MKDFWAEELQNQRKGKFKKLVLLIGIIIIIITIISLNIIYMFNLNFRRWCNENVLKKEIFQKNTKIIELDADENSQIYAYDKYICICRKKTLQFYNRLGTLIEEIDIDINNAVFTSAGRYMAISEENGKKFYLICGKEKLFESTTEGNISKINVSENGYVTVVFSNASYKAIVDVYNKNGKEIFKTNLVSSIVADISISKNSKYLAIAEVDISGILIKSSIQIVSIEMAQTNPSEATLYKYDALANKLIMDIEYQERDKLVCMYNEGIEILENEKSTEILQFNDRKLAFMTINLSNRVAVLEEISTGEYTSDTYVKFINPSNSKKREYIASDVAKSIKTSQNKVAINFGSELHIINTNGILLKKYISDTEINEIVMTEGLVGIIYRDKIQIINL